MAAFPGTLPKPQATNYGGSPDRAFIRTEMESGSQRQRLRYTAALHQITLSWVFKPAEMNTFKTFFDSTINRGTDFFTMNLDIGAGIASYNVRFTSPYDYQRLAGANWQVSAKLEVRGA